MAVQELAASHADLDSHAALAEEVARLVGGPRCRPTPKISHSELVQLLYHASFRFTRGETAQSALPQSEPDRLRREKSLGSSPRAVSCAAAASWFWRCIYIYINIYKYIYIYIALIHMRHGLCIWLFDCCFLGIVSCFSLTVRLSVQHITCHFLNFGSPESAADSIPQW